MAAEEPYYDSALVSGVYPLSEQPSEKEWWWDTPVNNPISGNPFFLHTLEGKEEIKTSGPEEDAKDNQWIRLIATQDQCYLDAVKKALNELGTKSPEDTHKWMVFIAPGVEIPEDAWNSINHTLGDAPEDAGAIMFDSVMPLTNGNVPIASDGNHPDLVIPMHAYSTTAIAYRPEMLIYMIEVYKANLDMTREQGGILPIDAVNCIIQQHLLHIEPTTENGKLLVKAFEDAKRNHPELEVQEGTESYTRQDIFAFNPLGIKIFPNESSVGVNSINSAVSKHFFASGRDVRYVCMDGWKLTPFDRDSGTKLHETFLSMDGNADLTEVANQLVATACLYHMEEPKTVLELVKDLVLPPLESVDAGMLAGTSPRIAPGGDK